MTEKDSLVARLTVTDEMELPLDRETLGRMVREAWVRWAQTQPSPKPSWLVPYDELSELDKEADRQIGEAIAKWTVIHYEARASMSGEPPQPCRFCNGKGTEADYVGLEMRCVETECSMCKGTGIAPQPVADVGDVARLPSGREIWECANQLAGYVGPNTEDRLAEFLLRESRAAEELAKEITRQSEQIASLTKERDELVLSTGEHITRRSELLARAESAEHALTHEIRLKEEARALHQSVVSRLAELEREAVKVVEPFTYPSAKVMGQLHTPMLSDVRAARAFLDKHRRPS